MNGRDKGWEVKSVSQGADNLWVNGLEVGKG